MPPGVNRRPVGDRFDQLRGDPAGRFRVAAGEDHPELVATDPGEDVRVAKAPPQDGGDLPQKLIAGHVAQSGIDVAEAVQVQDEKRSVRAVPAAGRDLARQLLHEAVAVVEAGHRVVVGQAGELLLFAHPVRDVLGGADQAVGNVFVAFDEGAADDHDARVSVGADDAVLAGERGPGGDRVTHDRRVGLAVVRVHERARALDRRLEAFALDAMDLVQARRTSAFAGFPARTPTHRGHAEAR